jgi:hypothetical protein
MSWIGYPALRYQMLPKSLILAGQIELFLNSINSDSIAPRICQRNHPQSILYDCESAAPKCQSFDPPNRMFNKNAHLTDRSILSPLIHGQFRIGIPLTFWKLLVRELNQITGIVRSDALRIQIDRDLQIDKPIQLRWQLLFEHAVIMVAPTKRPTQKHNPLIGHRHHGILQRMVLFFRCKHRAAYVDEHKAQQREPERRSDRAKRDEQLEVEIERVWQEHFCVYGARKLWRQLSRKGIVIVIARCTVERLMRKLGLEGVRRGQKKRSTTVADDVLERPADLVRRVFRSTRPNQLRGADIKVSPTTSR